MRRHINIDGNSYTPDDIEANRERVIAIRDLVLEQNDFDSAVILSHTIARFERRNIMKPNKYGKTVDHVIAVIIMLLLLLMVYSCHGQIGYYIDSGKNMWQARTNGSLIWDTRQLLRSNELITTSINYISQDGYTQYVTVEFSRRASSLAGFHVERQTSTWFYADGRIETNSITPDPPSSTIFTSGGSQGIIAYNSAGIRYLNYQSAVYAAYWKTNDAWIDPCMESMCTIVWIYRDQSVSIDSPAFIGAFVTIKPGETKLVSVNTPTDRIWKLMGTDKCVDCGSCWLAGWPEKRTANGTANLTVTPGSVRVAFPLIDGTVCDVHRSEDLSGWRMIGQSVSSNGVLEFTDTNPPTRSAFYRYEIR